MGVIESLEKIEMAVNAMPDRLAALMGGGKGGGGGSGDGSGGTRRGRKPPRLPTPSQSSRMRGGIMSHGLHMMGAHKAAHAMRMFQMFQRHQEQQQQQAAMEAAKAQDVSRRFARGLHMDSLPEAKRDEDDVTAAQARALKKKMLISLPWSKMQKQPKPRALPKTKLYVPPKLPKTTLHKTPRLPKTTLHRTPKPPVIPRPKSMTKMGNKTVLAPGQTPKGGRPSGATPQKNQQNRELVEATKKLAEQMATLVGEMREAKKTGGAKKTNVERPEKRKTQVDLPSTDANRMIDFARTLGPIIGAI